MSSRSIFTNVKDKKDKTFIDERYKMLKSRLKNTSKHNPFYSKRKQELKSLSNYNTDKNIINGPVRSGNEMPFGSPAGPLKNAFNNTEIIMLNNRLSRKMAEKSDIENDIEKAREKNEPVQYLVKNVKAYENDIKIIKDRLKSLQSGGRKRKLKSILKKSKRSNRSNRRLSKRKIRKSRSRRSSKRH